MDVSPAGITFVMNFKNMPEYDWRYGYPGVLLLMATIVGGMMFYFRKKRWI
jgi:magnesium transporter